MIEETGIVIELGKNGLASVRVAGGEGCGSCPCRGACQALGGGNEKKLNAINRAGATIGDQVLVRISSGSVLKASFFVYLVPIFALLVGSFVGARYGSHIWATGNPETVSVLMGLFCLGASFMAIRLFNSRLSQNQKYYPVIIRTVSGN